MSPWKGVSFDSQSSKQEAAEAFNVKFQEGYYCGRNYVLRVPKQARTTPTKLLVIASLQPKEESLPWFSVRWDEKGHHLNVDIHGVGDEERDWFQNGQNGYAGHLPQKVSGQGHAFDIDIRIPNLQVFRGCLSFDLKWNVGVRVQTVRRVLKANDPSVDTVQK